MKSRVRRSSWIVSSDLSAAKSEQAVADVLGGQPQVEPVGLVEAGQVPGDLRGAGKEPVSCALRAPPESAEHRVGVVFDDVRVDEREVRLDPKAVEGMRQED